MSTYPQLYPINFSYFDKMEWRKKFNSEFVPPSAIRKEYLKLSFLEKYIENLPKVKKSEYPEIAFQYKGFSWRLESEYPSHLDFFNLILFIRSLLECYPTFPIFRVYKEELILVVTAPNEENLFSFHLKRIDEKNYEMFDFIEKELDFVAMNAGEERAIKNKKVFGLFLYSWLSDLNVEEII